MTYARISAWLVLVLLALSACAGGDDAIIVKDKTLTPQASPTPAASPTAAIRASATPTRVAATPLPLQSYSARRYTVSHPQGWLPSAAVGSDDVLVAPPGETIHGLSVRWLGSGYTADALDTLINGEIEAMRAAGLLPQEVGSREAVAFSSGTAGRAARVEVVIGQTPARLWITSIVANSGGAYLLRFWYPAEADDTLYTAMQAQIARSFTPLDSAEASATPTITLTPSDLPTTPPTATMPPTATWTASPPPTVETVPTDTPPPSPEPVLPAETVTITPVPVPLEPAPYEGTTFIMSYPAGWTPTLNLDGSVTFLPGDPALLAGINVQRVGTSFDLAVAPANLLNTYLAEVAAESPDVVISEQRLEEINPFARGVSTTYVLPYEQGRLVYRVTLLVSVFTDGTGYRILQWADEPLYNTAFRELYRGIVMAFRPLAAEAPQTPTPQGS